MIPANRIERRAFPRWERRDRADVNALHSPKVSRALVPAAPAHAARPLTMLWHNHSPFIAQVIANAAGVAQTRARRRAHPSYATQTYTAVGTTVPARPLGRYIQRAV